jgi:hypothetical protein
MFPRLLDSLPWPELDEDAALLAEMYLVHVSLDRVPDADADLRRVPTSLHLPHQTVVRLRDAGRTILARNKQYQDFLASNRSVRSPTDGRPAE